MLATMNVKIIERITECLREFTDIDQIVLFGSYATGTANDTSDIDLLIVRNIPFENGVSRKKELARIYRALVPIPIPKDILLFNQIEVHRWKSSTNHLIAEAYRSGKIIYEKSGRAKNIRSNSFYLVNQFGDRLFNRIAVITHVPEFCKPWSIDRHLPPSHFKS